MENDKNTSAAAAAASASRDDFSIARGFAAVEQLTSTFGFDAEVASQAVEAVGPDDLTACYNYILDQGLGQDQGGPVTPIDNCPHVQEHVKLSVEELPQQPHTLPCSHAPQADKKAVGGPKSEVEQHDDGSCPSTENWLCLQCGVVRCSRYANAHGVAHWEATQQENDDNAGHCVAVSLTDLSVWCHVCQAYLRHPTILQPLLQRLEQLKFAKEKDGTATATTTTGESKKKMDGPDRKKARWHADPDAGMTGASDNSVENSDDNEKEERIPDGENNDEEEENALDDRHLSDNEEEGGEGRASPALDLDGMDDNALLQLLQSVATARGIPLSFLMGHAYDDDDDGDVEYPFDSLPTNIQQVGDFIQSDQCRKILVLAGAGMSVSSGIPDYRSADGFYASLDASKITASPAEQQAIRLDPTVALQQPLFLENPLPCLELKRDFILGTHAQRWKATLAHRFVELLDSKTHKLARLYTQNIDGLEDQCTDLSSSKVIPVHGSMDRAECASCGARGDFDTFCGKVQSQIKDLTLQDESAPTESTPIVCSQCGQATMKPAIVLFRSSLPTVFFDSVPDDVEDVDLLIVMGTSLQVAPANSLVWRVPKSCLRVLINREPVGEHLGMRFDDRAKRDFHAQGDCEEVVLELMQHLGWLEELGPLASNGLLPESSAQLLEERLAGLATESSGQEHES